MNISRNTFKKLFNFVKMRGIHLSAINCKKVVAKNGKSSSSTRWLTRQLSDPYVEKSKTMNLRCRSAFKLIEIDDKYKFLTAGQVVIDCGAAPGSWTQVAVKRVNANALNPHEPCGIVISIDKQPIYPIEGAIILGNADFTQQETQTKLRNILQERKVNVFLSDMAPHASGVKEMDDDKMVELCYSALRFALQVSEVNACFLVKLWQSKYLKGLEQSVSQYFQTFNIVKPPASRANSAEIFLLARNFKGLCKT